MAQDERSPPEAGPDPPQKRQSLIGLVWVWSRRIWHSEGCAYLCAAAGWALVYAAVLYAGYLWFRFVVMSVGGPRSD
jgi:hypothetical protein